MPCNIAQQIGYKLTDPSFVKTISNKKENFIPYIQAYPWDSITLSHGLPALMLLFSELDDFFPHQGWDRHCYSLTEILVKEMRQGGFHNYTLFSGLTGICFSILIVSEKRDHYKKLLSKLVEPLLSGVRKEFINPLTKDKGLIHNPRFHDVITGISGILPFLMASKSDENLTRELAILLSEIANPIMVQSQQVSGWYLTQEYLWREDVKSMYPHGCFDCGVAHGIAGVLSTLSKTYIYGIQEEKILLAIKRIVEWLLKMRQSIENFEKIWPARIGANFDGGLSYEIKDNFYRDGWCYGSPGIAYSLFLASKALKDEEIKRIALETLISVCRRLYTSTNLECVSFCHGWAGLLTTVQAIQIETDDPFFKTSVDFIVKKILDQYDDTLPFGFKCLATVPGGKPISIDNPGLLDGVAGTALSLLFASSKEVRSWTQIFLI